MEFSSIFTCHIFRELFEKAVEDVIALFKREKMTFLIPKEVAASFRQGLDYQRPQFPYLFAKIKLHQYESFSDLEPLIHEDNIFMPFVFLLHKPFHTVLHLLIQSDQFDILSPIFLELGDKVEQMAQDREALLVKFKYVIEQYQDIECPLTADSFDTYTNLIPKPYEPIFLNSEYSDEEEEPPPKELSKEMLHDAQLRNAVETFMKHLSDIAEFVKQALFPNTSASKSKYPPKGYHF